MCNLYMCYMSATSSNILFIFISFHKTPDIFNIPIVIVICALLLLSSILQCQATWQALHYSLENSCVAWDVRVCYVCHYSFELWYYHIYLSLFAYRGLGILFHEPSHVMLVAIRSYELSMCCTYFCPMLVPRHLWGVGHTFLWLEHIIPTHQLGTSLTHYACIEWHYKVSQSLLLEQVVRYYSCCVLSYARANHIFVVPTFSAFSFHISLSTKS